MSPQDHTTDASLMRADVKGWIEYIGSSVQLYLPDAKSQQVSFTHKTPLSLGLFEEAYKDADKTANEQKLAGFGHLNEVLRGLGNRSHILFQAYAHSIDSLSVLEEARVEFIGKKGELNQLTRYLGQITPSGRTIVGPVFNEMKTAFTNAIDARKAEIKPLLGKDFNNSGQRNPIGS